MLYTYLLGTSYLKGVEPADEPGVGKHRTMYLQKVFWGRNGGQNVGYFLKTFWWMSIFQKETEGQKPVVRWGENMTWLFQNIEARGCAFFEVSSCKQQSLIRSASNI